MMAGQGLHIPLVLFGHMHSSLKGGCTHARALLPYAHAAAGRLQQAAAEGL